MPERKKLTIEIQAAVPSEHQNRMRSTALPVSRGFEGVMLGTTLQDLIQMECLKHSSRAVRVTTKEHSGQIYFSDGLMVHAHVGDLSGEPAVFEMLTWKNGDFQIQEDARPAEVSITRHWQGLLLEAAARTDETGIATLTAAQEHVEVIQLNQAQFMQRDPLLQVMDDPEVISGVQFRPDGSLMESKGDDPENLQAAFAFSIEMLRLIGQSLGAENLKEVDLQGRQNKGLCVLNEQSVACFLATPKANITQLTKKLV